MDHSPKYEKAAERADVIKADAREPVFGALARATHPCIDALKHYWIAMVPVRRLPVIL
jgi:hypothetical protein